MLKIGSFLYIVGDGFFDRFQHIRSIKEEDGHEVAMSKTVDSGQIEVWLEGKKPRGGYALVRTGKDKRGGRVFIEVMRNARGQTAVPPYAVRARGGAPVATPLDWGELSGYSMGARVYTVKNLFRGLSRISDPWKAMRQHRRSLRSLREKLYAMRKDESP